MLREAAGMPEMGSARDELLVEARHLTVKNGGLSRPATLQIVETSIASSGVRGGRMSGSRRASIVFPPPGAPMSSTLCGRFPTLSDRVVVAVALPITSDEAHEMCVRLARAGFLPAPGPGWFRGSRE